MPQIHWKQWEKRINDEIRLTNRLIQEMETDTDIVVKLDDYKPYLNATEHVRNCKMFLRALDLAYKRWKRKSRRVPINWQNRLSELFTEANGGYIRVKMDHQVHNEEDDSEGDGDILA